MPITQVLDDFGKSEKANLTYRHVVKGFDYSKYLKDLKDKTIIRNQGLDDTIMSIVTSLE